MTMSNPVPGYLFLKVILVWFVLSMAGFFWGNGFASTMTPFYEFVTEAASTDYVAAISVEERQEDAIVLAATAIRAKQITPSRALPAGTTISSDITVLHTLVPLIIFLTIILCWPIKSWQQSGWIMLFAIPSFFCISAVTAPIQLLGLLEMGFQNAAHQAGFAREEPFALKWMLLTEGGGRWLIPALFGLACGAISEKMIKK